MNTDSPTRSASLFPSTLGLFQDGFQIFRQEWRIFVRLGFAYIGALIFFVVVIATGFAVAVPALSHLGVAGAIIFVLVALAGLIFFYWLLSCVILTILYVIQESGMSPNVTSLFMRARRHVWPFIWVSILTLLVVMGLVSLLCLASFIVFGPLAIVLPGALSFVAEVAIVFVLIAAILLAGTWFGFTTWMFIDKDARGIHAIALSRHLSHHHFVPIAWRLFWIAVVYVVVDFVLAQALTAVFFFLPRAFNQIFTVLLTDAITILLLIPILGGTMFSLYKSADTLVGPIDTGSAVHGEHRGMLIALAAIGLLVMLASVSAIVANGVLMQ